MKVTQFAHGQPPHSRRAALARIVCALALSCAGIVMAQSRFPEKPIRVVLAVPAGGAVDALARMTSEIASKQLGQPILIDNKPGAGGAVAINYLKQQPADGYTLFLTADATFTLMPAVRKVAYRPIDDFSFVTSIAFAPSVFAVPTTLQVNSMRELVAKAKAEPGRLNYGSMLGVPQHVDFERFKKATGSDIALVPYPGGAPIVTAMLSGQIQVGFMSASLFSDWAKQGKMKILATTSPRRLPSLPEVPTLDEAGFGKVGLDDGVEYMLVGPAGMSADVAAKIHNAYAAAWRDPALRKKLEEAGYEVGARDGQTLRAAMVKALAENERTVPALGLKLEE